MTEYPRTNVGGSADNSDMAVPLQPERVSLRSSDLDAASEHTEFRVKVRIKHDLPRVRLYIGDDFLPSPSRTSADDLVQTLEWWNSQGHEAVLQKRVVRVLPGEWSANG